jgi:hypothetical protein
MISPRTPLPFLRCAAKPKRLPLVKRMTITVGFVCSNGLVLGADSQESVEGSALRRSVTKLVAYPPLESQQSKSPDRRAVFTGSGDSQLIDKLIEEMSLEVASANASFAEISSAVEKRIKQLYREYRNYYHPGYMPQAQITYGLWSGSEWGLFFAQGPIITQVGTLVNLNGKPPFPPFRIGYKASGMGNEITDYINARMGIPSLNVSDGIVLAMYMLEQAVAHASGCGGDIRITWLAEDGTAEHVPIEPYRLEFLRKLDRSLSKLFLSTANFRYADNRLEAEWNLAKEHLLRLRHQQREQLDKTQRDKEEMEKILEEFRTNPKAAVKKYRDKSKDQVP